MSVMNYVVCSVHEKGCYPVACFDDFIEAKEYTEKPEALPRVALSLFNLKKTEHVSWLIIGFIDGAMRMAVDPKYVADNDRVKKPTP